jgi:hypothetical protein
MAKPRKPQSTKTPAPDPARNKTGREAIHGNNADYGDRVSMRAYELYLSRGAVDGRDFDDWITAEREVTNQHQGDRQE